MSSSLRLVSSRLPRSPAIPFVFRWTRNIHHPRPLPYPVEGGLGKFLPPPALKTFTEYQDGLLQRLNDELRSMLNTFFTSLSRHWHNMPFVADPKIEPHASVVQTVIRYAHQRERTLAFNYAVLALNNSFFLDQLVCCCFLGSIPNILIVYS